MTPVRRFLRGFRFAGTGVVRTLHTERNMRMHFAAATGVIVWNLVVRPPTPLVVADLSACVGVIAAELLNTAVEAVVDLAARGLRSAPAAIAKDSAAGAVLVVALGSLVVAAYVGAATFPWRWRLLSGVHPLGAGLNVCGLLLMLWATWNAWRGRWQVADLEQPKGSINSRLNSEE